MTRCQQQSHTNSNSKVELREPWNEHLCLHRVFQTAHELVNRAKNACGTRRFGGSHCSLAQDKNTGTCKLHYSLDNRWVLRCKKVYQIPKSLQNVMIWVSRPDAPTNSWPSPCPDDNRRQFLSRPRSKSPSTEEKAAQFLPKSVLRCLLQ